MVAETLATLSTSDALAGASEATEFGAAIRDMRLAHNTDLATVASTLRIRLVYLQAIEDGRFTELPGPTYAAGFVRTYAEYLGLDLSEVMRRYREVALGLDRQAPLVAPSPVVEGTMPTGFILLVAAVLAVIAYGSWYYLTLNGRDVGDIVAHIPQQIAEIVGMESGTPETSALLPKSAAAPGPTAEAARNTADQSAPVAVVESVPPVEPQESPVPTLVLSAPAQPEKAAAAAVDTAMKNNSRRRVNPAKAVVARETSRRKAAPVTETVRDTVAAADHAAVVAPEPAAGPVEAAVAGEGPPTQFNSIETTTISAPATPDPVTAADVPEAVQTAALPRSPPDTLQPEPPSRVVLRATATSWVESRDANGKRVFSRLLKKGETYNVPGRSGITLSTGNAGALDVLVDGQAIGPLGPVGAVRRDVLLEPTALLRRGDARQ
jgi:cytoskeletal protein RodZ